MGRHGYRSLTTHFVRIFLCNHWFFSVCVVGVEVSILVSENVCEWFTAKCASVTSSRVVLVLRWLQCVVQTSALRSSDATRIHKQLLVNQLAVCVICACARLLADICPSLDSTSNNANITQEPVKFLFNGGDTLKISVVLGTT